MFGAKVVLISNATGYVGPAAISRLVEDGAQIVAQSREFADAATRRAFADEHPAAVLIESEAPHDLVHAAISTFGQLDCVVSNDDAPAIKAAVVDADLDVFRAGIEEMLVRPFALAKAAIPVMKAQGGGRIVLITSAAPLRGLTNYCMYAAARGGANALTLSLARELAAYNIIVNAIAPNYVANPTYFPETLLADASARAKIERNIPLGRLGRSAEIGALVSFYAIGDCGFVTGHVTPVAGGWA